MAHTPPVFHFPLIEGDLLNSKRGETLPTPRFGQPHPRRVGVVQFTMFGLLVICIRHVLNGSLYLDIASPGDVVAEWVCCTAESWVPHTGGLGPILLFLVTRLGVHLAEYAALFKIARWIGFL